MSFVLDGKHEKDKRACRDGYIDAVLELMDADKKVVHIDCDLKGCINVGRLDKAHPDQVYNAGIAEANAVGIASGMAASGLTPFIHTFGIFASRRVFDQAFLSAGYSEWPVHIVGSDPGVTAAFNGATHMPFEDCALYLSVPNATVVDPADYAQCYALTKELAKVPTITYQRLIRKGFVKVYEDGSEFELGKGVTLRDGNDVTIIASGIMVDKALQAEEALKEEGISARVIDMHTWKPLDEELIIKAAKETGAIVTAEYHQVSCGLGSAIANVLAQNCLVPQEFVGIQNRYGQVGPQDFLEKEYNLMPEDIVAAVKKVIARK